MYFSRTFIGLLAASLASAQLPDVPACSVNCFVSALNSDGCSSLTDFACHCQKPELISKIQPCVQQECNIADQNIVSNVVVFECSVAGHPIHLTPIEEKTTHSTTHSTTTETATHTATTTATESALTASSNSAAASSSAASSAASSSPASKSAASASRASTTTSTSLTVATTATTATTATESPSATSTTTLSNDAGASKGNMVGVAVMAAAALYML